MTTSSTSSRRTKAAPSTTAPAIPDNGDDFDHFLAHMQDDFSDAAGGLPMFETDAKYLYDGYLAAIPEKERQHYRCNCCKHFIERYGHLVHISENGVVRSVFWDSTTRVLPKCFAVMEQLVLKANVTGVFKSSDKTWGTLNNQAKPSAAWPTGVVWSHLAVVPHASMLHDPKKHGLLTASQYAAEKLEDFKNVCRALDEYSLHHIEQAVHLLNSDALYRAEKVLAPAAWLLGLAAMRNQAHSGHGRSFGYHNKLWRAVATAPAGFCHPRSSMIGTLLEDLKAGKSYAEASKAFAEKMHPLQYQRPTAAPRAGTIQQAEKLLADFKANGVDIERALKRRFVQRADLDGTRGPNRFVWAPHPLTERKATAGGVFGAVKAREDLPDECMTCGRNKAAHDRWCNHTFVSVQRKTGASEPMYGVPPIVITWEKFERTVLPDAEAIHVLLGTGSRPYHTLVTASDETAPPIIQWDSEHARNPMSWYVWNGMSTAANYGVSAYNPVRVTGIVMKPSMWSSTNTLGDSHSAPANHGRAALFLLDDASDRKGERAGLSLFPEILKSEFHGIRSVIESFSKQGKIEGFEKRGAGHEDGQMICGLGFCDGKVDPVIVHVTSKSSTGGHHTTSYKLDRWD